MFINPFIAGVICTLFAEMAIVILYAILTSFNGRK
jgi:hypothetical protein